MLQYRAIACRLAEDRAGRVLDWGCGFGQVTHLLKRRGLDVTAFDYRPDIEEDGIYPLERFPDVEAYLSADAILLPYEDESFDSVLSCGVLEHVRDPDASLEEIRRVLQPGGTFYVYNLANRYSYLERVAEGPRPSLPRGRARRPAVLEALGRGAAPEPWVSYPRVPTGEHASPEPQRQPGDRGRTGHLGRQPGARADPRPQPRGDEPRARRNVIPLARSSAPRSQSA